ncbi:MAG: glycyl radical protein [Calditrichales bacterium]|nr:MAG: glycyl radical protein [Calditrichales bacterium]
MRERIRILRQQSLDAINHISAERASLLTQFYKQTENQTLSVPVKRAMALQYILEHKSICINPGELIVGERGPAPKATPTYPEICLHSLADLDILDNRPKVSFKVDTQTRETYKTQIIPFWQGRTQRDRIFAAMDEDWLAAYRAGLFTEFQEQRAPGHTVSGAKTFKKGMQDLIFDIGETRALLDSKKDAAAAEKEETLTAMEISAHALTTFARRYAEELRTLAIEEPDPLRKAELKTMADICDRVPWHAPSTFHEALQHYWFVHLAVITELNPWDSFNPGRLDQHLYPFYIHDMAEGRITDADARELLQAFWIKFNNHPAPPKIGVTAKESNTYTDFCLINIGGLKEDGTDAVNELSYMLLDIVEEMRILQPSSMVQISKKNPDKLLKRATEIIKTGFGQPSLFNTDAIIQELTLQGKSIEDARNGGASGCVEAGAFGTESYILTGYINLVKIFEITLHNGIDPASGEQIGFRSGDPRFFESYAELRRAYQKQLQYIIDIKIIGNHTIDRLFAENMPMPFLSLLIDDCIANASDYNAGGARYDTSYLQGVGLGSLTDILTAIKYRIFDYQNLTMNTMLKALGTDFSGYESLRHDLVFNTPKYGNDDDYADTQAKEIFEMFYQAVNGRPTFKGGTFRINMLPTTSHVYFGSVVGATADGRKAGQPLSEGISPVQGADTLGPTAVLKSAAKLDQVKSGGTLLNQKFSPSLFEGENGIKQIVALVRSYFKMDGHHIQFNVVSADILRDAQRHPEKHRDLIVRVAGYSDYFNDLGEELQNEIIGRTEHSC